MFPHDALTNQVKTMVVEAAAVAGTSDLTTDTVDLQGFDSVRFIAHLGALTTTHATKLVLYAGDAADGSDKVAITSGETALAADGDSNHLLIADCVRPPHRYITAVLDRGTANAVLNGIIAELYNASSVPVTMDGSVTAQVIVAPTA